MSVYTPLSPTEMADFIHRYDLGEVVQYQGAEGGIENTNYFIVSENNATQFEYVLTIFESLSTGALPHFIRLMSHLVKAQLPVPTPIADRKKCSIQTIKDKPAILFPRLRGVHITQPTTHHCKQIGRSIAQLHQATAVFSTEGFEDNTLAWAQQQVPSLLDHLDPNDNALLKQMSMRCSRFLNRTNTLPRAIIHGDLFRDNALFTKQAGIDVLSGLIDFYHSGPGLLLYDLAVAVNDWCVSEDNQLDPERVYAMVSAYQAVRPLTLQEKAEWSQTLVFAAFRFWVSRLRSQHLHQNRLQQSNNLFDIDKKNEANGGLILTVKDPDQFKWLMLNNQQVKFELN